MISEHEIERFKVIVVLPSERVRKTETGDSSFIEIPEGKSLKHIKDSNKLSHYLKGDLDNIVLKAMHKDQSRRYGSVEQFSEDIKIHLSSLPVIAQKDTTGYRLSKFIQRHKVGFVSSIVFLLFMIVSIIAIAWQANVASNERDNAKIEADKFERVNKFLQNMLSSVDLKDLNHLRVERISVRFVFRNI